ncbi:MarR family transcriptional regulator [Aureimonas jatrophae]|jgi:DNA-binding MarR family transcriptional regulator|uniref:MarR family protein n=1 Tax=Aureimonas jatrophae TaxID=1166073 RepID=A0A1H0LUF9_9HYPH|nr:MarR family transcriptional regulator [Aureimonas jatrophae]MBB3952754.1 DNA-binding MarR family transcriptional regulator [Aureimonas jatrophae]SDO71838.1 MarR family protein [Aureimonas jatrophae]
MVEIRPAQALRLLHRTALAQSHEAGPDLTLRQTAILLTIYLEPPPHTVRGLAERLGVRKPVITRALDTMGRMDLLERRRDPADARVVLVRRTVKGSLYVSHMADRLVAEAGALNR